MPPRRLDQLAQNLPTRLWTHLQALEQLATAQGLTAYLVGGLVRDVCLARPSTDIDVVLEGAAVPFAEAVCRRWGGKIQRYPRFGTATWLPPDGDEHIDLITARRETYAHPGALPTIEPATIIEDLQRRDFTINTLALRLRDGRLLDPHGGQADLEAGVIRVLHDQSFVDDATRIWRAVRYEQRLSFALERHTAALLEQQRPYLQTISPDRLRHELEYVLREPRRHPMLAQLATLGVLAAIHPELSWHADTQRYAARWTGEDEPLLHLLWWLLPQTAVARTAVLVGLRFPKKVQDEGQALAELVARVQAAQWHNQTTPSEVVHLLQPYAPYPLALQALCAIFPPASDKATLVQRYYQQWRHVKTAVNGQTLRQRGLPPGPIYKQLLAQLLAARLNGQVTTPEEEQRLLDTLLKTSGDDVP